MNKLFTVFQFELMSYIKNKSFMIATILLAVCLGLATFIPRFFDMSEMLGIESTVEDSTEDVSGDKDEVSEEEMTKLGIVDTNGYFSEDVLTGAFVETKFTFYDSLDDMKKAIEELEVEGGFYVIDDLNYEYYVWNSNMMDNNPYIFNSLMSMLHKQVYCAANGLDYATFVAEYDAPVNGEQKVLGKDAEDNYWYCYALVIIVFMIIIFYGVMIATSVTTEKSNRAIEVLVTSIDSTYLLFGKVFAGTVAAVVQMGLILGAVLLGYSVNHTYWGDKLDMLLDIPGEVMVAFAVFGVGGFLFYSFLYGAMGALASKTEDINKTAGTLQMVIMIVYFISIFQLTNPDGILMKVCSFLPISSYSSMFVRIGMGSVEMWEIVVSAVVLYASIFFVGWVAAKIYRMGTLRYGNPISLTKALKDMKNVE